MREYTTSLPYASKGSAAVLPLGRCVTSITRSLLGGISAANLGGEMEKKEREEENR